MESLARGLIMLMANTAPFGRFWVQRAKAGQRRTAAGPARSCAGWFLDGEAKVFQLALGFAGDLAAEQRAPVAVQVDTGGLLGQRLFPAAVQGDHAHGVTDGEGN